MSNGRRFDKGFWIRTGVIAFLVIAIIVALNLRSLGQWLRTPETLSDQNKYLLSATAQVLAALFALVFSITLIATQFVTKYTHRTMQLIFNKWVIGYMIAFAAAIIIPLACLSNPTGLGAFISVAYGSVMIILLIPFFLDLKKRMNIEWILKRFVVEGLKELADPAEEERITEVQTKAKYEIGRYELTGVEFPVNKTAEEKVTAIDNIAMGAYGDKNYEVFRLAEMALLDFALKIEQKFTKLEPKRVLLKKAEELHKLVFRILRDTSEETKDNPRAPIIVVRHIGKKGVEAIENNGKYIHTWTNAGTLLVEIDGFPKEEKKGELAISSECAEALYNIAFNAPPEVFARGAEREARSVYSGFLWDCLVKVYKNHLEKGKKEWDKWRWLIVNNCSRIEKLLKKFAQEDSYRVRSLLPHYCEYIDIPLENKGYIWAGFFEQTINDILPTPSMIEYDSQEVHLIINVLNELGERSKSFFDRDKREWQKLGEWLLQYSIKVADRALEIDDPKLFVSAQNYYLEALASRKLNKFYFLTYFPKFITQTIKAFNKRLIPLDEKWRENIGKAIKEGTQRLFDTRPVNGFGQKWNAIKKLSKSLLKESVASGWIGPIEHLTHLFWDIIIKYLEGKLRNYLSDEERPILFRYGWWTFAAYHTPLEEVGAGAGLNLAATLADKEALQDFLNEYENAKKEGQDLNIPERKWNSAWRLFNSGLALL